ncbi:MAG: hypothetical protein EP329_25575 [Deltaproteobacteria bacterium]|nr:MAG: hypothetical protein EP329_25575 [Deltaproteobacteria bacterium]
MSWRRIRAVMGREALEIRRNKMVLMSMALLPLLMVGVVIASLLTVADLVPADLARQGFVAPAALSSLEVTAAVQVLVNDQNMLYLILTPTLLPVVIGAYSIIGEKETRSLEPLLATPVRTGEIVLGKTLAAVTPAVLLGLVQFALALGAIGAMTSPPVVAQAMRPMWIVGVFVAMPLLSCLSTLLAVVVSARVNDVRTAQAISSLVVLPIVGSGIAVLIGQIYLTTGVMVAACGILLALDLLVGWLAVRAFGRESILARLG